MTEITQEEGRIVIIAQFLQQYAQIVQGSLQVYGATAKGAEEALKAYKTLVGLRRSLTRWGEVLNEHPYRDTIKQMVEAGFEATVDRLAVAQESLEDYLKKPEVREVVEPAVREETELADALKALYSV